MKVRNGFVSNSSSSSYIIAFNDMTRLDLETLFVSGSFSGDQTSVDAVGIKDVIDNIKGWYSIGEERYDFDSDEEKANKYHWDQFVHFAGMASRISRVVEDGSDVALVCISYGDEDSLNNLSSEGIRVIEGYE